jgi:hypothetical protein
LHTAGARPVDLDRYAVRVGSRVDQVKRNVRAGVGEQSRALAEDHGDDEQGDLVDEVVLEQPADQAGAAVHLCSSPAGLAFSSPMAAATSPERTVESAHCGSVSVVDATYLGVSFNATPIGVGAVARSRCSVGYSP